MLVERQHECVCVCMGAHTLFKQCQNQGSTFKGKGETNDVER